jgi:hypothetical protein
MSIETRDKVIAGVTYRVSQLPAKVGRNVLVRVVKQLGPGLAGALSGAGSASAGVDNLGALVMGASEAIGMLCARLSPEEFDAILDVFARHTTIALPNDVEPKLADKFDEHFAGRYDAMLQWAAFCMEVNFGSFFDASAGPNALWQRAQTFLQSLSPTASTGTSGASPVPNASTPA